MGTVVLFGGGRGGRRGREWGGGWGWERGGWMVGVVTKGWDDTLEGLG